MPGSLPTRQKDPLLSERLARELELEERKWSEEEADRLTQDLLVSERLERELLLEERKKREEEANRLVEDFLREETFARQLSLEARRYECAICLAQVR